ncbi:type VI secretion system Vgr family protein [Undibacterium sp. Ren11W]|uniref:type VI secretion system Vgr family protein n=1 Tax=Undibacterium sp. Ren11W TaxID=3413045 RepID=UPI003BF385F2
MSTSLDAVLATLFTSRQTNRLLRLSFPKKDGPKALMVVNRLDASEGVSRDFKFTVEVISNDPGIALKQVQGKLVSIELTREDGSLRYFSGYVFEFRLVKADGGQVYYEMVLLPWLAYCRLRRDNYLFHDKTLLDQTEEIFGDYPVRDSELRISNDPAFTDAMQFDETDYNYLHRRWEQQGWFYWYEHRADGHTLILSDDSTQAAPIDGFKSEIPFQRAAGSQEDDAIGDWSPVRHIVPGSVALSSFDFKNPNPKHASLPSSNVQGEVLELESYEYSGGFGFKDAADGDAQSRLRMEEIEARGKHFEGSGNDRTAQPGRWFKLTNHFDSGVQGSDDNADTFLILEVRHSASNNYQMDSATPAHYSNHLSCIRKIIPYRPGRGFNSTEPKIYGLQTALVTGPAGEEIHTDEYGRVRVQFHWDRVGSYNEKSSAWIRVATAWSGPSFGMTSIPRVGTEVIVQFLDGNPDRPLITGMVPNAATKPAWDLPANKTQSGILSRSSPGGSYSNANAIRFEDKMGKEQLWLHAEKDQLTEVEHDEDKWVGNDRRKTVDHDETNHIKHDRTETVDNDETITVHNNRKERVDHNETISIGDNRTEDVGKNETISIGANRTKTIAKNEKDSIGKNWSINVARMKTETIGMAYMQNVGMGRMENVGMGYSLNVGLIMSTIVGMNQITKVGQKISVTAGEELSITVGKASLVMKADGTVIINGSKFNFEATGPVQISGKDVDIN